MTGGLRIIFMGTPVFAAKSLKALLDAGLRPALIVTQPEKPRGRGMVAAPSAVKELALESGIEVIEPVSLKDAALVEKLKAAAPDVIVVVAYGKILPKAVLKIPRLGCVNVHASLLPAYRGAAPINHAIINGDKKTGVTTMLMDEGMDTGPVLISEETEISGDDTAATLYLKLAEKGGALLVKTIGLLVEGKVTPKLQDDSRATYAPPLKKEDGLIDWTRKAQAIANRVRGFYPWPGAYTRLDSKTIKIHAAKAFEGIESSGRPGSIKIAAGSRMLVKCGSGELEVTELQLEGKKRMTAAEFLRGYRIEEGKAFD